MDLIQQPTNILLELIERTLNDKNYDVEKIQEALKNSIPAHKIQTFSFLSRWLLKNTKMGVLNLGIRDISFVVQIFSIINHDLSPIHLINSYIDFSDEIKQHNPFLFDINKMVFGRIGKLKSYLNPKLFGFPLPEIANYSIYNRDVCFSKPSDIVANFVYDPFCNLVSMNDCKRLLLNHYPVSAFKQISEQRKSRSLLTRAIIDILRELNNTLHATQEQLIFSFSYIFLYIHAFTLSNQIDGQILCDFLHSCPSLSPFCVLAIVNHIPVNIYLYNLLLPRNPVEATENESDSEEEEEPRSYPTHFFMVDKSENSTLSPLVEKMPQILKNYFSTNLKQSSTFETCSKTDDNEFFTFIHLCPSSLYNKMKAVLGVARDRTQGPLGSLHVSAMGILLLRCVMFSLQRTLGDCADNNMFTQTFTSFIKSIITVLSPTFSDQLAQKFLDHPNMNPSLADLTLRACIKHLLPAFLHLQKNPNSVLFCLSGPDDDRFLRSSRIFIGRLLTLDIPKIDEMVLKAINDCTDIVILLEFLESITNTTFIMSFESSELHKKISTIIINKIPFSLTVRHKFPFVSYQQKDCSLNASSKKLIGIVTNRVSSYVDDLELALHQAPQDQISLLRLITFTNLPSNKEISIMIINSIKTMLNNTSYSSAIGPSKFEVRQCEQALFLAQSFLPRLFLFGFPDLAIDLMRQLDSHIRNDSSPVHFVSRFLQKHRSLLSIEFLGVLKGIIESLPNSKRFFVSGDSIAIKVANIIRDNEMVVIQDPQDFEGEFQSLEKESLLFSVCSILLVQQSDREVSHSLIDPIFDAAHLVPNKESCCVALAKLAAVLNYDVSTHYILLLLGHTPSKISVQCGRVFLYYCSIDVFKYYITTCFDSVDSYSRISLFLRILMPNFSRLSGDTKAATDLVLGLIKKIRTETPPYIRQDIVDSVSLIVSRIETNKVAETLPSFSSILNQKEIADILSCIPPIPVSKYFT